MTGNKKGKAGCGCLLFIVIVCMVLAALLMHPFSLRVLTGLLIYQDKVVPADALVVPRFLEDKNGELYQEAFREFWAGNGKTIYVEDDQILGIGIKEIVAGMAKQRGIKENVVRNLEIGSEDKGLVSKTKERLLRLGLKKVILLVPEYASRRFHLLYGSEDADDKVIFLVKPVTLSYFKREKWWANEFSRAAVQRELYALGSFYLNRFKYGPKEELKEDSKKR
jgi:hypothetical protein